MGESTEPSSSEGRRVPPILYLPCKAGSTTDLAMVEMRELEDGRVALMAYTALDRLAWCCGEAQPWVLFRTEALGELRRESPFDIVLFDQPIPDALRHGAQP